MRGIKEVWNFICGADKKLIQKVFGILVSGFILTAIVSAGFMSCTPNFDVDSGSSRDSNNNSDDDDDDEDDGEKCLGHETCEKICEKIYYAGRDQVDCQEEGRNKVGRLDEIYDLLKTGDSRDLEKIFPDEDGVELDDLEDYLNIGISGVEDLIDENSKGDDYWDDINKLGSVLKWIIDEEDVANVLNGLDDNGGHRILEELLDRMEVTKDGDCISKNSLACGTSPTINHVNHYDYDSNSGQIEICTDNRDPTLKGSVDLVNGADIQLYDALSCVYNDLRANGKDQNVFSYASVKNNSIIFNMAYNLLNDICENVDDRDPDHQRACRKALLCWTGVQSEEGDDPNENFFREYVNDHRNDLEKDSGGSDYNQCQPRHFADFF